MEQSKDLRPCSSHATDLLDMIGVSDQLSLEKNAKTKGNNNNNNNNKRIK